MAVAMRLWITPGVSGEARGHGHSRALSIIHSAGLLLPVFPLGHTHPSLPSPAGRFYSIFKGLSVSDPLEPSPRVLGRSNHDSVVPTSKPPALSPFLTLLQPHRLPCSFLIMPSQHQPRGLCMSYSFCLKCPSPRYPHAQPLHLHLFTQMSSS